LLQLWFTNTGESYTSADEHNEPMFLHAAAIHSTLFFYRSVVRCSWIMSTQALSANISSKEYPAPGSWIHVLDAQNTSLILYTVAAKDRNIPLPDQMT
jgi:hypothetical protein